MTRYLKAEENLRVVVLDNSLCKEREALTVGTIAHEFAHTYLKHDGVGRQREYEVGELAANEQTRRWGFSEGIDELCKERERRLREKE